MLYEMTDAEQSRVVDLEIPGQLYIHFETKDAKDNHGAMIICTEQMETVIEAYEKLRAVWRGVVWRWPQLGCFRIEEQYTMCILIPSASSSATLVGNGLCKEREAKHRVVIAATTDASNDCVSIQVSGSISKKVVQAVEDILAMHRSNGLVTRSDVIQLVEANRRVVPELDKINPDRHLARFLSPQKQPAVSESSFQRYNTTMSPLHRPSSSGSRLGT
jgi:hypothetical protein